MSFRYRSTDPADYEPTETAQRVLLLLHDVFLLVVFTVVFFVALFGVSILLAL